MIGCSPQRASAHRRFRKAVMDASPRVLAADATGTHETELTLSGTDPVPAAVSAAIGLHGLGVALVQDQGAGKKVVLR